MTCFRNDEGDAGREQGERADGYGRTYNLSRLLGEPATSSLPLASLTNPKQYIGSG